VNHQKALPNYTEPAIKYLLMFSHHKLISKKTATNKFVTSALAGFDNNSSILVIRVKKQP
jgi:hypothetical protein